MLINHVNSYYVADLDKDSSKASPLNSDAVKVKTDSLKEWCNIFNEAWRVNRDYFYDPGLHGVDWDAAKVKYQAFLPHITSHIGLNCWATCLSGNLDFNLIFVIFMSFMEIKS